MLEVSRQTNKTTRNYSDREKKTAQKDHLRDRDRGERRKGRASNLSAERGAEYGSGAEHG